MVRSVQRRRFGPRKNVKFPVVQWINNQNREWASNKNSCMAPGLRAAARCEQEETRVLVAQISLSNDVCCILSNQFFWEGKPVVVLTGPPAWKSREFFEFSVEITKFVWLLTSLVTNHNRGWAQHTLSPHNFIVVLTLPIENNIENRTSSFCAQQPLAIPITSIMMHVHSLLHVSILLFASILLVIVGKSFPSFTFCHTLSHNNLTHHVSFSIATLPWPGTTH